VLLYQSQVESTIKKRAAHRTIYEGDAQAVIGEYEGPMKHEACEMAGWSLKVGRLLIYRCFRKSSSS